MNTHIHVRVLVCWTDRLYVFFEELIVAFGFQKRGAATTNAWSHQHPGADELCVFLAMDSIYWGQCTVQCARLCRARHVSWGTLFYILNMCGNQFTCVFHSKMRQMSTIILNTKCTSQHIEVAALEEGTMNKLQNGTKGHFNLWCSFQTTSANAEMV